MGANFFGRGSPSKHDDVDVVVVDEADVVETSVVEDVCAVRSTVMMVVVVVEKGGDWCRSTLMEAVVVVVVVVVVGILAEAEMSTKSWDQKEII